LSCLKTSISVQKMVCFNLAFLMPTELVFAYCVQAFIPLVKLRAIYSCPILVRTGLKNECTPLLPFILSFTPRVQSA
jgi:hypothetical protein